MGLGGIEMENVDDVKRFAACQEYLKMYCEYKHKFMYKQMVQVRRLYEFNKNHIKSEEMQDALGQLERIVG